MKQTIFVLTIFSFFFACKPAQKVQKIEQAIYNKDTTGSVRVKETPKVDSAAIVRDIMQKVMMRKIDITTFEAKIKVDYEDKDDANSITAYVKLKKDSVINIKLTYPVIGVLFELQAFKDSVILLNYRNKTVQYRKISYLQEITEIPFDFTTLQDMILGNPVFINGTIVSYKDSDAGLLVLVNGDIFKHLITLEKDEFKVTHSKLDDIHAERNRTCDITLSNYETLGAYKFSTLRKISIAEKSKLDISLDFKKPSFNQPLTLNFSIPRGFKRQ